jgi:hypothetical protein
MSANWPVRALAAVLAGSSCANGVVRVAQGSPYGLQALLFAGVVTAYVVVAAVIIERRRGNVVGPILLAMGAFVGVYLIADTYLRQPEPSAGAAYIAWAATLIDAPLFTFIGILFLVFPDGRFPSPRWRRIAMLGIASSLTWVAGTTLKPGRLTFYVDYENPFGVTGFPGEQITTPLYLTGITFVVVSVFSLVGRWRRAEPVERAQLKWVAAAATLIALAMGSYAAIFGPGQFNEIADLAVGFAFGFFPVAIGIAILRYRLFEIDRLVSRTIAYGAVSALLVAAYASVILILQGPLGAVTGGETISVAISTLVVAALFQPLRRRVQRAVDHRFDRSRYDAERTTASFAERLRNEVDLPSLVTELHSTVNGAISPSRLGVWLRARGR